MLLAYPWAFVLFGTVTNVLSFVAFSRPQLRKNSTFFYLCFLSIVDMFSLHLFCVNLILLMFDIDLQKLSIYLCKAYAFLIYFLPQLSAWICAAVSLDRVLCVLLGVKARQFNNPKFSLKVLITMFVLLALLNIHFFYYPNEFVKVKMIDETILDINIIYCSLEHNLSYETQYALWVNIDLFVNVLIPFSIMIVSSVIIICKVARSARNITNTKRKSLMPTTSTDVAARSMSVVTYSQVSELVTDWPSTSVAGGNRSTRVSNLLGGNAHKQRAQRRKSSNKSKARSVSKMLALNNLMFISLSLPIVVFLSLAPGILNNDSLCLREKVQLRFIKVICIVLMNMNYLVNIFVYSAMSTEFRLQLIAIRTCIFNKICFCACRRN